MVGQIITLFTTALQSIVEWFGDLLDGVNGAPFLIAVFFMLLSVKTIIMPAIRTAGSDSADSKKGE